MTPNNTLELNFYSNGSQETKINENSSTSIEFESTVENKKTNVENQTL